MEIADWIDRLFAARTGPAVAAVAADLASLDRRIAVAVPFPHSGGGRRSSWVPRAARSEVDRSARRIWRIVDLPSAGWADPRRFAAEKSSPRMAWFAAAAACL